MNRTTTATELIKRLSTPLKPIPTGMSPLFTDDTSNIKAVIFDVYGTLFISAAGDIGKDSASDSAAAMKHAAQDAGITPYRTVEWEKGPRLFRSAIRERHEKMKASGVEYPEVDICEVWTEVLSMLGVISRKDVSQKTIELFATSYECRTNPVWPMPKSLELISTLGRKGILLGIISNAQFYTPLLFRTLLGKEMYELGFERDLSLFSWQEGVAKPSQELFNRVDGILKKNYAIDSSEALYVGNDMLKDVLPAHRTGWKTALYAGDQRSLRTRDDDPRIRGIKPWCIITSLDQLI